MSYIGVAEKPVIAKGHPFDHMFTEMAENAVYVSSIQHSRPTIFEIWAEESFMKSLQPAFHLLCDFIKSKLPQYKDGALKFIFERPDEAFLVFNFLMQSTYLDWFSASFSEAFYGLKRVNASGPHGRLTLRAKMMSLVELVLVPYAATKLKSALDSYIFERQSNSTIQLLQSYKLANVLLNLVKLYHYVSYLSGSSVHHSVLHRLAGVKLRHRNRPTPSWTEIFSLLSHETNKSKLIAPLTFKLVSQMFEIGAFSLQFIDWWNSSESGSLKFNKKPIPGPVNSVDTQNVCPICRNPWKVEVVVAVSGITYCFSCINQVLNSTGRCPVTDLPFTINDLIRLYPATS